MTRARLSAPSLLSLPSLLSVLVAAAWLSGCASNPPAVTPATPEGAAFKELASAASAAADNAEPLKLEQWWLRFQDPALNGLEQRLADQSPDLAGALARYQQARAASDALGAAQSPVIGLSAGAERDRQSEQRPLRVLGPTSPNEYNSGTLGLNLQYELDLWGRVREQVSAGRAQEKAAQADLASARLSLQAQLADTVMALRGADRDTVLLRETETAYQRALTNIDQRHQFGLASGLDLARAQAQLEATRSQVKQAVARRAVLEHAIAALVGEHPSTFSLAAAEAPEVIPAVPAGLPSTLLQRRPDIAAAQQRIAAANANVGVARSAFFPSLMLNAQGGYQSSQFSNLISAPNLFWSLGPSAVLNLFDGGRREADEARAKGVLEETAQNYRGLVLGAFQQVEDQLAMLNQYAGAAEDEARNVAAAQKALTFATDRYRLGATSYLDVVTAQAAALQAQRSLIDLTTRQRRATVQLTRALGGGWSIDQLASEGPAPAAGKTAAGKPD